MASPGDGAGADAGLIFHPRPPRWRLRRGELVLLVDLPCAGGDAFFEVLAACLGAEKVGSSARWPLGPEDLPLVAADVQGARVIRAHVDYEFYRFLPRPPAYVTILRDPVERVVALYERVRRSAGHPYHRRVTAAGLSLHEFVCEPAFARDVVDVQARRIAGDMFRDPSDLPDRVALQMAQANLGEFAFFGLAERMDESVHLLAYTFGWPYPRDLDPAALGPETIARAGIAPATLEAIEARTRVDRALVQFAREQFRQRVRAAALDLLDQNARASEPYVVLLGENERLRKEYARLQNAWSWRTAEMLKAWRRRVAPPGTRRDRLYQRLGIYVFGRGRPAR